ncbi:similar to Saccharomyces cerevisiae YGR143W SKN1 Protein involved in sphingolipid biosynthesis [Maudiozyma saulgeensis]|uniref:Similar to Saccharomyces cerevisiae YGR143W SKN1 Protein involved in sphingolipid biosynthesis n=1 Tax=Maudiozyma saulgeensis TaxID=1789683 RepID=A0A1X7QXL6_9SACH|nr:similar to Saccharomyces cerevisiae YGR143W SKN1 Protein involved in sphingolipid biosynthesis [Kazachstania saulgeensis]
MGFRNLTGNYSSNTSSPYTNEVTDSNDSQEFEFHSPRITNPFATASNSSVEEIEEEEDNNNNNISSNPQSSDSLLSQSNSEIRYVHPQDIQAHIEQDYKGYYSKKPQTIGTPENRDITGRFIQTPQMQTMQPPPVRSNSENRFIQATPPYDRYPIVNSRLNSQVIKPSNVGAFSEQTNGISESQGSGINNYLNETNGSTSSSSNYNPALLQPQDFSPFGGYPASSFPLTMDEKEDDDFIHNPDPEEEARLDRRRMWDDIKNMNARSFLGLIGILVLLAAGICVFVILPALTFTGAVQHKDPVEGTGGHSSSSSSSSSNSKEILTNYKYPTLAAIRTNLVDPDTPTAAKTRKAKDGSSWKLVFSDEFNAEGRTFYDGDDQFWTAPDIHYDATKDLEWYDPDAVTTKNGTLHLRMDAFRNHDLYYRSGMVQSWNKLCFTQGILEVSANLPNYGSVTGLWPGLWTMGNLGRPGYLASTEGVWPYSYDSCDAGITPNQSSPDGISYLPGQRLNACTCDGEEHPNPGVGRGAPEIDIIEGEVDTTLGVGLASQSMQIAPFDIWYMPDYDFIEVYNFSTTNMNTYAGGPFQQAISAVSTLNTTWYEFGQEAGYYQKFALEYLNDDEDGYARWFVGDNPTFTIYANALHPNGNIDWRRISKEPMSIVMNLGISNNWAYIDWRMIFFPVQMSVDYVRLYQPSNAVSITCDPEDYPTYDYIESHKLAYTNANLTHWIDAGYSFPANELTGNCKSSNFSGTVVLGD